MVKPSARKAINKLAIAGEQAGFSIEQMIELLSAGLSVETLLDLISWRLQRPNPLIPASSAHWVVGYVNSLLRYNSKGSKVAWASTARWGSN